MSTSSFTLWPVQSLVPRLATRRTGAPAGCLRALGADTLQGDRLPVVQLPIWGENGVGNSEGNSICRHPEGRKS